MGTDHVNIIQVNDVHGYLQPHPEIFWEAGRPVFRMAGGYGRIQALVDRIRADHPDRTLLCDCGDTLHGTYPLVQTKGQILVPILNRLKPDAMTVHWEFAYTPKVLKQVAEGLNYPILACNIYAKDTREPFFGPCLVKQAGDIRIGVAGVASNIVDKTMPAAFSEGLVFTDGRAELPGIVQRLRERERVDIVVLLSHLGFPQDVQLVSEVPGVDIVLSGHTHNRLEHPVIQGDTIIVQSGSHGSFVTTMAVGFANGKVHLAEHALHEISAELPTDPETDRLISAALEPYREELSEVVGETVRPLHRGTSLDTTMDNLLLQSLLEASGADIAFSNGWRYGAPIVPGPITLNDLYNIIPMNPPVSTVDLSGAEILEMLEGNLERTYSGDAFGQMGGYAKRCAGLTALIRIENPKGTRIQKLFIGEDDMKPDRTYRAAFVTAQGVPVRFGKNRQDMALHAVEAMRSYLRHHWPLDLEPMAAFIPV